MIIKNGTIVSEGKVFAGDILIVNDRIEKVFELPSPRSGGVRGELILDATGCLILPGVIDTHVHFREPGMTHKADIESESRAAAYGGVTSFFDMPNCIPQTTTLEALQEKQRLAAEKSYVNYAFFFGATTENTHLLRTLDKSVTPGVKLFMGSSTGNMLVDKDEALAEVFRTAAEENLLVMAHCEDNDIIKSRTQEVKQLYGEDADVSLHPFIRNREACLKSTLKAISLAKQYNTRLHIAHISTKEEATLTTPEGGASEGAVNSPQRGGGGGITFEACLPHILFNENDYAKRGARIKCNPAVKTEEDRQAIIKAIRSGLIATVATDHAPHTIEEKLGGCLKATSGMPMLQFSLVSMLEMFDPVEVVRLMAESPARLFGIKQRGYIREGYKADIVIVRRNDTPWTLTKDDIQSKCGWSPLEGDRFHWQVLHTFCNGNHILDNGTFNPSSKGEQILFSAT